MANTRPVGQIRPMTQSCAAYESMFNFRLLLTHLPMRCTTIPSMHRNIVCTLPLLPQQQSMRQWLLLGSATPVISPNILTAVREIKQRSSLPR